MSVPGFRFVTLSLLVQLSPFLVLPDTWLMSLYRWSPGHHFPTVEAFITHSGGGGSRKALVHLTEAGGGFRPARLTLGRAM